VNPVQYKDLFLGVRQYDCNLDDEDYSNLIEISKTAIRDPYMPGFQYSIFGVPAPKSLGPTIHKGVDHPSVDRLRKSFIKCCKDYCNIKWNNYECSGWFYLDWKSNSNKKLFWHRHSDISNYTLSGVLYLTLPEKSTTTGFSKNPRIVYDIGDGSTINEDEIIRLPKLICKWFIYPSTLPHIPGVSGTDEMRICIASDFWFT
jgi:hypothetical protein